MTKLQTILRIILAIILIIFGINKFFGFIPMPEFSGNAKIYWEGLSSSGFTFPLLGIVEVFVGILLLTKKAVPFALILLAPISINMVLFHIFMAPLGILPAAIVFILNTFLIFNNWNKYHQLFK